MLSSGSSKEIKSAIDILVIVSNICDQDVKNNIGKHVSGYAIIL